MTLKYHNFSCGKIIRPNGVFTSSNEKSVVFPRYNIYSLLARSETLYYRHLFTIDKTNHSIPSSSKENVQVWSVKSTEHWISELQYFQTLSGINSPFSHSAIIRD
jgi:hypothetical protein